MVLAAPLQAEVVLERSAALGGQIASGNTELTSLHADFRLNRNRRWIDEVTFNGSLDYETSAGQETMFRVSSALRYGLSINKQLYNFARLEADYDRFQGIGLRLVPTLGLGCWFADEQVYQMLIEGALGYQREYHRNSSSAGEVVFQGRSYLLLGCFSNDLNLYAAAADLDNFRLVNESALKSRLSRDYSFKCLLRNEYNNRPAAGAEKHDLRLVVGIEYAFKESRDWIF